jgi:hypothetical protein
MGLIYYMIKRTKTRQLIEPVGKVNRALLKSRSDREHYATIERLQNKKPLTKQERREFRNAINTLKKRGILRIVKEIEE